MIAYKVFKVRDNKLYPFWMEDVIDYYPLGYTHTRAKGCGPFACFDSYLNAKSFLADWNSLETRLVIRRVFIKPSKVVGMWVTGFYNDHSRHNPYKPRVCVGIVYADEFEILEQME